MASQPRYVRWVATYGPREEEMTKVEDLERIRWAHFREGVSVRPEFRSKWGRGGEESDGFEIKGDARGGVLRSGY